MTPCGREGTKVFFSVATTKDEKSEEYFDKWQAMHNRFINEDLPILNSMRLGDLHLVGADRAMIRFMLAARNYPRTTLDAIETSANAATAMVCAPWRGGGSTIPSGRCPPELGRAPRRERVCPYSYIPVVALPSN